MAVRFRKFAIDIAELAYRKKCKNIIILDVRKLTTLCDYFVIITVSSTPQMKTVYNTIIDFCSDKISRLVYREDTSPSWRVLDYVGVVINLMMTDTREFYSLERIWYKAKKVNFK